MEAHNSIASIKRYQILVSFAWFVQLVPVEELVFQEILEKPSSEPCIGHIGHIRRTLQGLN